MEEEEAMHIMPEEEEEQTEAIRFYGMGMASLIIQDLDGQMHGIFSTLDLLHKLPPEEDRADILFLPTN